jgi:daunorubicin resistance ABC transporter ATP-binding subunit
MNEMVINIKNLTKKFEDSTAVNSINLTIKRGELFGLLGPNGAGKTTTINILCGLLIPTSGSAEVAGYSILKEQERVKEIIGVCPQETALYPFLTGRENVELFGLLHSMPKEQLKQTVDNLLEKLSLTQDAKKRVGKYSGGMKRRINLVMALVHNPEIAFLDEPTVAMDPQSRHAVWEFIKKLKQQRKTIILTTHYMEEAEYLCDRVGIIDHGRIIALDTPKELMKKYHAKNLEEVFIQLTGKNIREAM